MSQLHKWHNDWLCLHWKKCTTGWSTHPQLTASDKYFFRQLAYHLHGAQRNDELRQLLFDYGWLEARLRVAGRVFPLDVDFAFRSHDDDLTRLRHALRLSASAVDVDHVTLRSQLLGRLQDSDSPGLVAFCHHLRESADVPWIEPLSATLDRPGGQLLGTFVTHPVFADPDDLEWDRDSPTAHAAALSPDGRLALTGSYDGILTLWDLETGDRRPIMSNHPPRRESQRNQLQATNAIANSKERDALIPTPAELSQLSCTALTAFAIRCARRIQPLCQTNSAWDHGIDTLLRLGKRFAKTAHADVSSTDEALGNLYVNNPTGAEGDSFGPPFHVDMRDHHGILAFVSAEKAANAHDGNAARRAVDHAHIVAGITAPTWIAQLDGADIALARAARIDIDLLLRMSSVPIPAVGLPIDFKVLGNLWPQGQPKWFVEAKRDMNDEWLGERPSKIECVAIAQNGKRAITGSIDGLKIIDLEREKELPGLIKRALVNDTVAISDDGLTAVGAQGRLLMGQYDLDTGKQLCVHDIRFMERYIVIAVTPDMSLAVTGTFEGELLVWDLRSRVKTQTLGARGAPIDAVAITPAGTLAITGSRGGVVKVWDLTDGSLRVELRGHSHPILSVALSQDGRRALATSCDGTFKVWDLSLPQQESIAIGHSRWIGSIAVTPHGSRAVSSSGDRTLKIWDVTRREVLRTLHGHVDSQRGFRFTMDGREPITQEVRALCVTPDGERVISGSDDGALRVWHLDSGRMLFTIGPTPGRVSALAITYDGRQLISGSDENSSPFVDTHVDAMRGAAGAVDSYGDRMLNVWNVDHKDPVTLQFALTGHRIYAEVTSLAVTPNGKCLLSGYNNGAIMMWDLARGKLLRVLRPHTRTDWIAVKALAVTPNGKSVIAALSNSTLAIYTLAGFVKPIRLTARVVATLFGRSECVTLKGHKDAVNAVAISRSGRFAVSTSNDRTLKVWCLRSRRCLATFAADHALGCCALCPDDSSIVCGDDSGQVHFLRVSFSGLRPKVGLLTRLATHIRLLRSSASLHNGK